MIIILIVSMSLETLPEPQLTVPRTDFDFEAYLQARVENDRFVMVELGHNAWPVAYQQDFKFSDGRTYIGIESWLRDPVYDMRREIHRLRQVQEGGQLIFFLTHDLGGVVHNDDPEDPEEGTWYEGKYDAHTILQEQTADEVFASNVLCDPLIGFNYPRSLALLNEMRRILKDDGIVLLRETTPKYMLLFNNELIATSGLQPLALLKQTDDLLLWETLEKRFSGAPNIPVRKESFYLALGKAGTTAGT